MTWWCLSGVNTSTRAEECERYGRKVATRAVCRMMTPGEIMNKKETKYVTQSRDSNSSDIQSFAVSPGQKICFCNLSTIQGSFSIVAILMSMKSYSIIIMRSTLVTVIYRVICGVMLASYTQGPGQMPRSTPVKPHCNIVRERSLPTYSCKIRHTSKHWLKGYKT